MREIKEDGFTLAIVDNFNNFEKGLHFYGSKYDFLQVGSFCYNKDQVMRNHRHIFRPRVNIKTQEIVVVFSGSVEARTYSKEDGSNTLVDTCVLHAGDIYISYWGGCGFTVLENDTRMLEAKNGPYDVNDDNEDRELIL